VRTGIAQSEVTTRGGAFQNHMEASRFQLSMRVAAKSRVAIFCSGQRRPNSCITSSFTGAKPRRGTLSPGM
jgi:hypothetical protein